ncbi:Thioesterase superfamily [Caloramator fervidus]|uniref:Thioesterase superfamily n=1 Tax=Caloramator fervidus TaxID=29344 RepID=A0A1H5XLM8_9CLOT|nr:thioesterase family protein [Caloramator fervidus]SEG12648.1 Thioesterase superfamily [Caloramator fervidus]
MEKDVLNKVTVGINSVIETNVKEKDSAKNYASGAVDVLSTPALIGYIECAAKDAVDLHLPTGYTTVGTRLDVKHLAATPIGMKIRAVAELIEVDGRRLVFKVEAYDEVEKIMEGIHERYIVNVEKFMSKVNDKK